jgi:hypothetical protein
MKRFIIYGTVSVIALFPVGSADGKNPIAPMLALCRVDSPGHHSPGLPPQGPAVVTPTPLPGSKGPKAPETKFPQGNVNSRKDDAAKHVDKSKNKTHVNNR